MSEAAVAESVTIAAVPERVGLARVFVAGVLGGFTTTWFELAVG